VNSSVLVPRPETELLAEHAWNFLSTLNSQLSTVLDFGTGSGCIAITVALKNPNAKIHAVDISPDALSVAKENAAHHNVLEKIEFHLGNGFDALPADLRFDLIVSNPPYIPSDEIATLESEVKDYDPKLALDGGADGLDFYRMLAEKASARLLETGKLMLEFGEGQADAIKKIFEMQKWIVEAVERDYSRRERILIAHLP
jgi:release factor glutamine methyltransferase